MGLFEGKSRLVRVALKRTGSEATIYRESTSPSENAYGKVTDGDRTFDAEVDTEYVRRIYPSSGDQPNESRVTGGRIDTESPRLAFMDNTSAEEGDRVEFTDTGRRYELDERIPRETHAEFRATYVNG